jgi:undecaprenyl-diphosphatase
VAAHGPLLPADRRLSSLLMAHSPGLLLAEPAADLGNPQVAVPLLLAALAHAAWRGNVPQVLRCLAAAVAAPVVVLTVKEWLDRPGPVPGTGYGYYPSGHAATTLVAFGAAALLLLPHLGRRGPLLVTVVTLVVVNGLGLVWRGYHWPVDVLASWCLGVLLLTWPALHCRPGPAAGRRPSGRSGRRRPAPPGRA